MKSDVTTVEEYINLIPEDRKEAIITLRKLILDNLPEGYEETMTWGMICYEIPLSTFPDTYNKKPLMYAALANQKNNMAVYLTDMYLDGSLEEFQKAYKATGKKLDMGKSCIRFKKLEDLPLDFIAKQIASTPVEKCIENYTKLRK
jgi:hypothetical protein